MAREPSGGRGGAGANRESGAWHWGGGAWRQTAFPPPDAGAGGGEIWQRGCWSDARTVSPGGERLAPRWEAGGGAHRRCETGSSRRARGTPASAGPSQIRGSKHKQRRNAAAAARPHQTPHVRGPRGATATTGKRQRREGRRQLQQSLTPNNPYSMTLPTTVTGLSAAAVLRMLITLA